MCPWLGNGHTGDKRKQAATRQDEALVPLGQTAPILQRQQGWKEHPVGGARDLPFMNVVTGRTLDYLFHKNPQSKKSYKQSEQVASPAQPGRGLTSVPAEPPPVVVTLLLAHAAARGGHEVLSAAAAADPAGGYRVGRCASGQPAWPRTLCPHPLALTLHPQMDPSPTPAPQGGGAGYSQSLGFFSSAVKMMAPPGFSGCGKG